MADGDETPKPIETPVDTTPSSSWKLPEGIEDHLEAGEYPKYVMFSMYMHYMYDMPTDPNMIWLTTSTAFRFLITDQSIHPYHKNTLQG